MMERNEIKKTVVPTAVIGSVIVMFLITASAVWAYRRNTAMTNEAVSAVSSFYMEEMANNRARIITNLISNNFHEMEMAMAVLEDTEISSWEELQTWIGKVETLLSLSRFALVDEDDIVYTRYTTYTGRSRHAFLSETQMSERVVSTVFSYGSSKQLCLAIPVRNLDLMEKSIKACFVQIGIDEITDLMSFHDENGTVFGLYYQNGASLSGMNPDSSGSGKNILTMMEGILPEAEAEQFRDNFSKQQSGSLTFHADGTEETMCYVPIPDTGWMLTAMIRESVIHDQIRGISLNTLLISRAQILITLGSMLVLAVILLLRQRELSMKQLEEEKKTSSTFKNMATTDSMTGVGNKHAYQEFETELNRKIANNEDLSLAVVVGDLNGLKYVNDTQGHAAGDRLIQAASDLIRSAFTSSRVYRIGGDEFVVILLGKDYENRETLLSDLNRKIEDNIETGDVVISLGWSELQDGDSELHEVFHRADKMMYARKKELKDMGAMTREMHIQKTQEKE